MPKNKFILYRILVEYFGNFVFTLDFTWCALQCHHLHLKLQNYLFKEIFYVPWYYNFSFRPLSQKYFYFTHIYNLKTNNWIVYNQLDLEVTFKAYQKNARIIKWIAPNPYEVWTMQGSKMHIKFEFCNKQIIRD